MSKEHDPTSATEEGAPEAEILLLGTILANNRAYDRAAGLVEAEDFSNLRHMLIFQALQRFISAGRTVTAEDIECYWETRGNLDPRTVQTFLQTLPTKAVALHRIPGLAFAIRTAALRWRLAL